ncbi:hypothetical protein OG439_06380 [Amycolatopsis sp. NBC_01307]|uniref:hypothetical protein n=1 Tax=Amycolatopsis sp. NBC_01307 TaxID=2903561 RepID=UPI002E0EB053|nr:hypothetical protein OG439_06380 [Amycolatopsis sp. NBC_01307]
MAGWSALPSGLLGAGQAVFSALTNILILVVAVILGGALLGVVGGSAAPARGAPPPAGPGVGVEDHSI